MGKLIVIEGLDGSGKATQTGLLCERLLSEGRLCRRLSFPDYGSASSAPVKMYLSGALGTLEDISPYGASLFYTVDRYASFLRDWRAEYEEDVSLISDRYTTSNVSHQMSRLPREEWDGYMEWLEDLEYTRTGLPRPDAVIYLDMQPETSRGLLAKRYAGGGCMDLHEADLKYLLRCREAALYGAKRLGWRVLDCCDGAEPLPRELIAAKIYDIVKEYLC